MKGWWLVTKCHRTCCEWCEKSNNKKCQNISFITGLTRNVSNVVLLHKLWCQHLSRCWFKGWTMWWWWRDCACMWWKDLLERLGHLRSYTGQSAWEDKVLAIVSFIHNPKVSAICVRMLTECDTYWGSENSCLFHCLLVMMMMKWCLMSSDVRWHIRDKLRPMPKHGSINLYVHGSQKAR